VEALGFEPASAGGVGLVRVDRPGESSDAGLFAPLEAGEAVAVREGAADSTTEGFTGVG
jgi:hypothetical protein